MAWVEIFAAFVVSHLVGDYLLQTDWQARNKRGGLTGGGLQRRALFLHVFVYTLAFIPALVWLADDLGAGVALVGALIFLPHLVQDDGRGVTWFVYNIKGCDERTAAEIFKPVDQTMHVATLFAIALVAAA